MFLSLFKKPDLDVPLVAAARTGDPRAFDALVYRYQGRLTQFVRARLDSTIDADDVAQEIFVAAWRELPRFQGRSRFKTWLFGIALKHCAEAARRHYRLKAALGELAEVEVDWGDRVTDPAEWSLAVSERDAIRHRLATLSESERRVMELYYYGELNLREISELIEVNLSTVKYRFYQAHRHLRDGLDDPAGLEAEPKCRRAK